MKNRLKALDKFINNDIAKIDFYYNIKCDGLYEKRQLEEYVRKLDYRFKLIVFDVEEARVQRSYGHFPAFYRPITAFYKFGVDQTVPSKGNAFIFCDDQQLTDKDRDKRLEVILRDFKGKGIVISNNPNK